MLVSDDDDDDDDDDNLYKEEAPIRYKRVFLGTPTVYQLFTYRKRNCLR